MTEFDPVQKAAHYNQGSIEAINFFKDNLSPDEFKGFLKATCMKYLIRYRHKGNPLQDLEKSQYYLNRLIKEVNAEQAKQAEFLPSVTDREMAIEIAKSIIQNHRQNYQK